MKLKISLIKLSLAISLLGILSLLLLSNTITPKLINIENINNKLLDKEVKIQGQIINIKTYEKSNFQVISIKDSTGKIDITLNIKPNNYLNLTQNQNITVIGKVAEYKGNLQIQADKISAAF